MLINAPTIAEVCCLSNALEKGKKIALCIAEVTVDGCIATSGTDSGYTIKFGAAKAGEVLITNGSIDRRSIICAKRELGGPSLAFLRRSFIFMTKATLVE